MRTRLLSLLSFLGAMVLVTVPAHTEELLVSANIPFKFEVRDITLPAGMYTIERVGSTNGSYAIRGAEGTASTFFHAVGAEPKIGKDKEWTFVFHQVGDKYFLENVWLGSSETGLALPKSKDEREALALGKSESKIEIAEAGH
jgi:hypothetical protein